MQVLVSMSLERIISYRLGTMRTDRALAARWSGFFLIPFVTNTNTDVG